MIDQRAILDARRVLGRQLAAHRQAAGLRQEQLAPLVHYGRSSVANVETGRQKGSPAFWQRCDEVLDAGGVLVAAYEATEAAVQAQRQESVRATHRTARSTPSATGGGGGGERLRRRRVVIDLSVLGLSVPLAAVEAVRHRFAAFAGDGVLDTDEWDEIAWEYGRSFYDTPVDRLLRDLTADLSLLEQRLGLANVARHDDLARVGGQLAAIAAMAWASAGGRR